MYFCITVDTEADNAWGSPDKIKLDNFNDIPRFQELCEKYRIIPTYLLSYEYATYEPAIEYLKPKLKKGKCEIGHHLHVWATPPYDKEKDGIDLKWLHAFQYELPDELFYAKSNILYETIEKNFGIPPRSHRAGRWGIDVRTIQWMASKDFIVDTSVVPMVDWGNNIGAKQKGPNFLNESRYPEHRSSSKIIEIPLSINYPVNKVLRNLSESVSKDLKKKLNKKLLNKLHLLDMLRPNPKYDLKHYDRFLNRLVISKMPVINMMLHSSELTLHCSPYTKTKNDHKRIWKILENVFNNINKTNYIPTGISNCATKLEI